MSDSVITKREILGLIARVAAVSTFSYFTMKWLIDAMDPSHRQQMRSQEKARKLLKGLGLDKADLKLNPHEVTVASTLVEPTSMSVTWDDIAGLDGVLQELRDTVILPIQSHDLFKDSPSSSLIQAPRGVLLHGPPGCGKTMVAKATAKECSARFINLDVSMLTDKWYGESQKLASAVFTLARKIAPCIVFIDEIDSLLRVRDAHDHEATAMIKAQFMQMWDGLETSNEPVVIMGATNRPRDVDRAILRRMPATFHIGLPNVNQRGQIFRRVLSEESVAPDVRFDRLAEATEGFSGSDIREVCRTASVYRMKGAAAAAGGWQSPEASPKRELGQINGEDLFRAVRKLTDSKVQCGFMAPKPSSVGDLD